MLQHQGQHTGSIVWASNTNFIHKKNQLQTTGPILIFTLEILMEVSFTSIIITTMQ